MDDHAEALELVEVPVDGGQVDVRSLGLDLARQFLGRPVTLGCEQRVEEDST
jgi:hypothetical protein